MIGETLPDPNSYAAIGWLMVIVASAAFGANQLLELVRRARGKEQHPPNGELNTNLKQLNIRVRQLEDWRNELARKLEEDKQVVLQAGEERAVRIHEHIERDRQHIDDRLDSMPDRIIATLKNTGAI